MVDAIPEMDALCIGPVERSNYAEDSTIALFLSWKDHGRQKAKDTWELLESSRILKNAYTEISAARLSSQNCREILARQDEALQANNLTRGVVENLSGWGARQNVQ